MDKTLNALLSSAMPRKAALVRDPSPDKFTLALLTSYSLNLNFVKSLASQRIHPPFVVAKGVKHE